MTDLIAAGLAVNATDVLRDRGQDLETQLAIAQTEARLLRSHVDDLRRALNRSCSCERAPKP